MGRGREVPYDRDIVRRVVESGSPLIVAADPVGVGNALTRQSPRERHRSSPPSSSQYGCRTRQSV